MSVQHESGFPPTHCDETVDVIHGTPIADPYRWLEGYRTPDARSWLERQQSYARQHLNNLSGRAALRPRVASYLTNDTIGVPVKVGEKYFVSRRAATKDQASIYMIVGINETILVDSDQYSSDGTTSVTLITVANDGKRLSFAVRKGGEDEVDIKILDVATRTVLPDSPPKSRYGCAFLADLSGFYYVAARFKTPAVFFHAVGTDPHNDREVFRADSHPNALLGVACSPTGSHVLVLLWKAVNSLARDYYLIDIRTGRQTLLCDQFDSQLRIEFADEALVFLTNWDAPNQRVLAAEINDPHIGRWREIIPEGEWPITDIAVLGRHIFVNRLIQMSSVVEVFDFRGHRHRNITFPVPGIAGQFTGNVGSSSAFCRFSSIAYPPTIFRYDTLHDHVEIWAKTVIPLIHTEVSVSCLWYHSTDGTAVPMFLAHRKDRQPGPETPTLLTAYGGFGVSEHLRFTSRAGLWIELGGLYASAAIRGGGEFGERWHQAAIRHNREKSFEDFISAAEWLIDRRYTSAKRLAAVGGSNGGLVVGVALTQRFDLFQAIICSSPVLDMLRYHLFDGCAPYVSEFGSADNEADFRCLIKYSPYHCVRQQCPYPAVMFVSGDLDTRCHPMHVLKMTARLQSCTNSGRPVILNYHERRGHAGLLPLSVRIDSLTDQLCFILNEMRVDIPHVLEQSRE